MLLGDYMRHGQECKCLLTSYTNLILIKMIEVGGFIDMYALNNALYEDYQLKIKKSISI